MIRHRRLFLLVAVVIWITAVAIYIFGKQWLWFGAGAVAAILGIHVALMALAFAFGGASLIGFVARWLHGQPMDIEEPHTTGRVIHWAFGYDLLVWALMLGRERAFREKTLDLAELKAGEAVLDIGCGTGSLAIAARRRVGSEGRVTGVDASPEMIARARRKAAKAAVDVAFETIAVESLPFPDRSFDVVLSTVMLHHLPDDARVKCIREVRRVLKPGGRMLIVEFGGAAEERHSRAGRLHNHAHFDLKQVVPVLTEAGLNRVDGGATGFRDLQFILAGASA